MGAVTQDERAARSRARLANEAWEALYRAQATLARELFAGAAWSDLAPHEYGVLYALANAPDGLRISDLGQDALLTQPGMSRLVARLEARGLVSRTGDPRDARAQRIRLTGAGRAAQRTVGLIHGREVARAMTGALRTDELETLREISLKLVAARGSVKR